METRGDTPTRGGGQTERSRAHSLALTGSRVKAHLDLLLQVLSSCHEVLNLPREDMPVGVERGALRVSSSLLCSPEPFVLSEQLPSLLSAPSSRKPS